MTIINQFHHSVRDSVSNIIIIILILIQIPLSSAVAEDIPLEPIVVTATKRPINFSESPRNVMVIERSKIEKSNAHSVPKLLKYALSVDMQPRSPNGVQADPSIRGSNFSQVLILIDGIRVNDPQTAHHNLDLPLTINDIERIEILPGHGSSLYGPDAFGGTINIITKVPKEKYTQTEFSYGSHRSYQSSASTSFKEGNVGNRLSWEKKGSDGYRYDTDFDITTLSSHHHIDLDENSIDLFLGYTDKGFGANDFYSAYPSREWTQTKFAKLQAKIDTEKTILQPTLFYRWHYDKYTLDLTRPDWYLNYHTTYVYGSDINLNILLDNLGNLLLGSEAVGEEISSTRLGDHKDGRFAVYSDYLLSVNKFALNAGIRTDYHTSYEWELSPSVSGSYQFSPLFKLRASSGRSFRAPSYTETYYTDASHSANSELKPEEAWSYELGMDYLPLANPVRYANLKNNKTKLSNGANIVYRLTYFRRDEEDIIDWVRRDTSSKWQTQNIQKVRITGLETSFKFNFLKDSSISLNYTLIESDLKEQESLLYKYSLREPRHQISLGLYHSLPLGLLVTLNTVYKKRTQENGFCFLDGKVSKKIKDVELFLAGTNLLSVDYEEIKGTPMPGRWMQFGIKTKF